MWTLLELGGLRKVRRSQLPPPCCHFALISSSCVQLAFSDSLALLLPCLYTEHTHGYTSLVARYMFF